MNEAQAIERLKQGDIGGLEPLVNQYYVRAVRAAFLVTRDKSLAEDVVQNAFIRAYERIDQFDPERSFGPWFLRSVVNEAINTISRDRRNISLEYIAPGQEEKLVELIADPHPGPDQFWDEVELRQKVWEALGQLSPPQRAAIVQRYYLGLSETEMADREQCAPGTVKWRLHSARQRLRTLISFGGK